MSFNFRSWLLYWITVSAHALCALSSAMNYTIDDTLGDSRSGALPSYPSNSTGQWKIGQQCQECLAKLDSSQTLNGTWHDLTFPGNNQEASAVAFNFTGSAIYVFCVMDNQPGYTTLTEMNFTIDGDNVGYYRHSLDSSAQAPSFVYNVTVYSNTSIPNGNHLFVMSSGGPVPVLLLFDYAVYTYQDLIAVLSETSSASESAAPTKSTTLSPAAVPSSHRSSNLITGVIVGVVLGISVLALAIATALRRKIWKMRGQNRDFPELNPTILYHVNSPSLSTGSHLPPPPPYSRVWRDESHSSIWPAAFQRLHQGVPQSPSISEGSDFSLEGSSNQNNTGRGKPRSVARPAVLRIASDVSKSRAT